MNMDRLDKLIANLEVVRRMHGGVLTCECDRDVDYVCENCFVFDVMNEAIRELSAMRQTATEDARP